MLTTHIIVDGAARAAAWYAAALGAVERERITLPDARLIHVVLEVGGSTVILADPFPEHGALAPTGALPFVMYLQVDDVDRAWQRAVAAGATVVRPLGDAFWGEREGQLDDPFGYRWGLAEHVRDVPLEEMTRMAAQVFGGGAS
jgi:uncharacterized glyoxalase superfamily protein PhnB